MPESIVEKPKEVEEVEEEEEEVIEPDEKNDKDEEEVEKEEVEEVEKPEDQGTLLVRLLSDPKTQKQTILSLAQNAGLFETPESKKEVEKSVEETLQEILGDEYALLPSKIGKAIQAVVDAKFGKLERSIEDSKQQAIVNETNTALEGLRKKYPDAIKLESKMAALMEDFQPGPKIGPSAYLEKLYVLAGGKGASLAEKTAERFKRVNRNLRDDGIKPSDSGSDARRTTGKMSLDDAVKSAVNEIQKGKK